jgi:hypothetical protein
MSKRKTERIKVREGSRLKLQNGNFARVKETPNPFETTVKIKEYNQNPKQQAYTYRTIPMGQIAQVVRY